MGARIEAWRRVAINLLGPIRLTAALLPHLREQAQATVMTVSSGLAFVPLAMTPTYCATKAAIHSYSQSLAFQLKNTSVRVIELAPPGVATDLMPGFAQDPRAMPLDAFIKEVVGLLKSTSQKQARRRRSWWRTSSRSATPSARATTRRCSEC